MPISEDISTQGRAIEDFWMWFKNNQLSLRKIIEGEYDLIDLILNRLSQIQKGLAVEFEGSSEKITMTVSADGVEQNFDVVKAIVQSSPSIESWDFVAFRQPLPKEKLKDFTLTVSGLNFDPNELLFLPIVEDNKLYIQIFSDSLTEENEHVISYGTLMLLDNIVGEYDCVTKVNGYEFYTLNEAKDFINDLKPLAQFRDFLEEYKEK